MLTDWSKYAPAKRSKWEKISKNWGDPWFLYSSNMYILLWQTVVLAAIVAKQPGMVVTALLKSIDVCTESIVLYFSPYTFDWYQKVLVTPDLKY